MLKIILLSFTFIFSFSVYAQINLPIDLSNYQKGTYFLTVTKNALSSTFKILKK